MAEFLTMEDAKCKFGTKGKTNAALTLGIIGTALGALNGGWNNNGSCCGNGGILGNLLGGNNNGSCLAERAMQTAMSQGEISQNLAWSNRVQSLNDDVDLYTYINAQDARLSKQNYEGRIQDIGEKCNMYVDLIGRDNAQNIRLANTFYNVREKDVQEKTDIFERLSVRINELEKREAATQAALPLMFELSQVKANKYTDDCCCAADKSRLMSDAYLQRQLDHKIDGQVKLAYNDLCAGVPSIAPLYCSPFTGYGISNYAGTAIRNFNAVDNAIDGTTGSCGCNRTNTL